MTKRKREQITRCAELQSAGWMVESLRLNSVLPHSGQETAKHFHTKAALARAVKDNGYAFATEVDHRDRGTVDVLDLHEGEPGCWVYEVETGCGREDVVKKAKQYTNDFTADEIQDVIVIDPRQAPDDIDELRTWARGRVVA